MRAGLFVIALGACGRIGFDPLGPVADATDATADATEAPCMPFDVTTTPDGIEAGDDIVWTGTHYVTTVLEGGMANAIALDTTGTRTTTTPITSSSMISGGSLALAWTGQVLFGAYALGGDITLERFDDAAVPLDAPHLVTSGAKASVVRIVAATDGHVTVMWSDTGMDPKGQLYLRELDATGMPIAAASMAPLVSAQSALDVGGSYLVADTEGVMGLATLTHLAPDGGVLGQVQLAASGGLLHLARGGNTVAMSWSGTTLGQDHVQPFALDGSGLGAGVLVPPYMGNMITLHAVAPTDGGFELLATGFAGQNTILRYPIDPAVSTIAAPIATGQFPAGSFGGLTLATASHRHAVVLPTSTLFRVIATCD